MVSLATRALRWSSLAALVLTGVLVACSDRDDSKPNSGTDPNATGTTKYLLGSVTIDADGNRKTYVQSIASLDSGPFKNTSALEIAGNGVLLVSGDSLFTGLAEEPTWVRYSVNADGSFAETGRLSFLNYGMTYMDFGNVIVDDETVVSVLSGPKVAVIWNPQTMTITGEVDLAFLQKDGYELETWTITAHEGRVYVPARYADWDGGKIGPGVSLTILDPKAKTIVATATDERCNSGGRVVFAKDGYGYVMGDGRNYSDKMFARAAGAAAPANCLLRIAPGQTAFDKDYFFTIPSLTGGRESISEIDTAAQGSGVAFMKVFYEDKLPAEVKPVDFAFWDESVHKTWRVELGNPPTAREVEGAPFAALGFTPVAFDGKFYSGESPDKGATSDVYETDPVTNKAAIRFKMDGYFYGIHAVNVK